METGERAEESCHRAYLRAGELSNEDL